MKMENKNSSKHNKILLFSCMFFLLFAIWTALVKLVDVKAIGPDGSSVGFASINGFFSDLLGYNDLFYKLTEILGLFPLAVIGCFGILGVYQLIKRKSLLKVDSDILILGIFYVFVLAVYVLFEVVVINHRPVLMDGVLEASYPSSHTLLALCVMLTADMQLRIRLASPKLRTAASVCILCITALTVIGRLLSGVHWFTDIVGGVLFSVGAVLLYKFFVQVYKKH